MPVRPWKEWYSIALWPAEGRCLPAADPPLFSPARRQAGRRNNRLSVPKGQGSPLRLPQSGRHTRQIKSEAGTAYRMQGREVRHSKEKHRFPWHGIRNVLGAHRYIAVCHQVHFYGLPKAGLCNRQALPRMLPPKKQNRWEAWAHSAQCRSFRGLQGYSAGLTYFHTIHFEKYLW